MIVSAHGPGMERSESERAQVWESLYACLAGFDENERVTVLVALNAKVGDKEKGDIIDIDRKFGVRGVNANDEHLIELCV